MAREIKFRGFNRKNNVWLYGFYLQNRGAHFVCPDEFATGKSWDDYEIDPDTRGEFTGRKDKNGKEIYEGDIVETIFPYKYEVRFIDGGFQRLSLPKKKNYFPLTHGWEKDLHIIGNIYDNPELLK